MHVSIGFSQSENFSIDEPTIIHNTNRAYYVFPSPNGKYVCFSDQGLDNVYIKKMSFFRTKKDELIYSATGSGYFPVWTPDSKSIIMRSKTQTNGNVKTETVSYVVDGEKIVNRSDIDYRAIQSYSISTSINDPIVYINEKLQLVLGRIGSNEVVILESEKPCYQPLLSPDKSKVAVHIGSDIWIYDISRKTNSYMIGMGIVTSWSPDSKLLIGFLDSSDDGHQISNSELYIFDTERKKSHPITNSSDRIEVNPAFSNRGNKLYFIDIKSGSIMSLKFNIR